MNKEIEKIEKKEIEAAEAVEDETKDTVKISKKDIKIMLDDFPSDKKKNKKKGKKKQKNLTKKQKKIRRILACVGLGFLCVIAAVAIVFCVIWGKNISEMKSSAAEIAAASTLEEYVKSDDTVILDADGNEIYSANTDTRIQIELEYDEIPESVINAFVAVEDQNFWTNKGYDLRGIIRVIWRYVITFGNEAHGASTITQQLARGLYLTTETTLSRKLTEIYLANYLTKLYSKEDIISAYVNSVYFANNFYGIEAAALGYFGKSSSELTLAEIAYLCAIPNSPSYYDPWNDPDTAVSRQQKILSDMLECGYITEEEYNEAINEEIVLQSEEDYSATTDYSTRTYAEQTMASYAINCAIKWKMEEDGFEFEYTWEDDDDYAAYREEYNEAYELARSEIYEGGYTIQTSLDPEAQEILQTAVDETLESSEEVDEDTGRYTVQSAATCIDNETGKVIAVVGGRTQEDVYDEYNRAYQTYRQPGSAIKPLVIYTPSFVKLDDDGNYWCASSLLEDIDVSDANAASSQAELESLTGDTITLEKAVTQSTNGAALYLYARIGVYYGLDFVTQMNFDKILPSDYNITSGLGGLTYGVTTEQMAGAYYTLYNDGYYQETTCIVSITDSEGNSLYEDADAAKVYETYATEEMTYILQDVITSGTAKSMGWNTSWIEAAGKTGTTNDNYDHWFCGYTPYYTIAVWIGKDNPEYCEYCVGNTYTGRIWSKAMYALCEGYPSADFEFDLYEEEDVTEATTEAETEEETEATEEETTKLVIPETEEETTQSSNNSKTKTNKSDNKENNESSEDETDEQDTIESSGTQTEDETESSSSSEAEGEVSDADKEENNADE